MSRVLVADLNSTTELASGAAYATAASPRSLRSSDEASLSSSVVNCPSMLTADCDQLGSARLDDDTVPQIVMREAVPRRVPTASCCSIQRRDPSWTTFVRNGEDR